MGYYIPRFLELQTMLGLYRLPSGRIAEIVDSTPGGKNITLRYLDDPSETVTVRKSWLAMAAVVV